MLPHTRGGYHYRPLHLQTSTNTASSERPREMHLLQEDILHCECSKEICIKGISQLIHFHYRTCNRLSTNKKVSKNTHGLIQALARYELLILQYDPVSGVIDMMESGNYNELISLTYHHSVGLLHEAVLSLMESDTVATGAPEIDGLMSHEATDTIDTVPSAATTLSKKKDGISLSECQSSPALAFYMYTNPLEYFLYLGRWAVYFYLNEIDKTQSNAELIKVTNYFILYLLMLIKS